jgi:hypothetical protein
MSERVYAWLLRLYPRAFRERYAQEMMRTFRDRLRHEPTVRLWIDVLKDAVVSIPHRHWVQDPHPIFPPSSAPLRAAYAVVAQSMLVGGALAGMMVPVAAVMAFELPGPWRAAGLVPVCLALYLTPWSLRRARRASHIVKSYQADTTPDSVTISAAGLAPLTLQRSEIVGLHLFEHVGLRIQAADPARDLWVPTRTSTFAAVSEHVSGWAPMTVTPFLHHAADNLRLAIVTVLAVVIPVKFGAGFVAGATIIPIIATLRRRDVPVLRKLLAFAPVLVLVVRWLW